LSIWAVIFNGDDIILTKAHPSKKNGFSGKPRLVCQHKGDYNNRDEEINQKTFEKIISD